MGEHLPCCHESGNLGLLARSAGRLAASVGNVE